MLVGRDRETRLLEGLLEGARAGHSAVLGVVGEVGMGKSALLDRARESATDMSVLCARGIQSEAQIPFAALFEVLRPALGHLHHLAAPQRDALEVALAMRPARARDRFAVGAATLGLLAAYADDAPVLVLVDDAHWIDGSSADALLFACRRLLADPIVVVFGVREGEPSLLDGTDVPVLRLAGLDRAATATLLGASARAGGPLADDAIDRLHRGTGGNPLALIELVDDPGIASATPVDPPLPVVTSVGRAYLERAASLSEAARDVLLLAAAGDDGGLSALARAAGLAGLDVGDLAVAEAVGLVVVGDRVEFRHPLARSAVYAGSPPGRRRAMHRAWAGALPDSAADRRAWHLALAALGPDDAASSALEQAAHRARGRSAYEVASQAFERAAALAVDGGRRCALLLAAADSAWLAGAAGRAVTLLDEARRGGPATEVAIAVEHLRGHIATRLGPVSDGHRILLEGAALAAAVDADLAVVMLAEAVNAAFYGGDVAAMREAASAIPPLMTAGTSRRGAFFGGMAQGMALIFGGDRDRGGAALVRQAVSLVEGSDELSGDPRLLAWAAMGPLWLRESEAGRTLIDRALDVARRHSAVGVLPFLLSHLAFDAMACDRWAEAEARFHESIDLATESGQRTELAAALARLAWLEARRGSEAPCRRHAAEAQALAGELDLGLAEIWAITAVAELELGLGNLDVALRHFEAKQAALAARRVGDVDLSPEPELIELRLRLGRREEAEARLPALERDAAAKGQPWALARAVRCRGLLGADDDLDRHFADALALHEQTPDVFETARTRVLYGGRLRRARRRMDAREQLEAAIDVFERLGARPWSDLAGAELAATGKTARRRDPSTRTELTPQELQIALLLGAGRTTREAAASLFLSPKTIEYHLRSIYQKLGVSSRDELAVAVAGSGPPR